MTNEAPSAIAPLIACIAILLSCSLASPCLADGLRLLGEEVTITPSNGWWNSSAYDPQTDQYLVLWQKFTTGSNLMGRCLHASTLGFAGPEFTLGTPIGLGAPAYIPDLPGGAAWMVVYATDHDIGGDILGRMVNSSGPVGAVITFSAGTGDQVEPAIAYDFERHRILVAWSDYLTSPGRTIRGRIFHADGSILPGFSQLQIGEYTSYSQADVTVVYNPVSDEYLLAWSDLRNDAYRTDPNENNNKYTDVYGQRVSAITGALIGPNIALDSPYVPGQPYEGDGLDLPGILACNTGAGSPMLGTFFMPVQQLTGLGWTMTGLILTADGSHDNGMYPFDLSHPLRGGFTGNAYNALDDTYITSYLDNDYDLTARLLSSTGQILATAKIIAHHEYEENFGSLAIRPSDGQCLQVTTLFENFATGDRPKTLVARRFIRDRTPPAPVTPFAALPGSRVVYLSWTNPADADFAGVMLRYDTAGAPATPTEGVLLADVPGSPGAAGECTHTGAFPALTYHYAAFAHDDLANHAAPAHASARPGGLGDFEPDGDVDQSDFARLQQCFSGDAITYAAGCAEADFDGDTDVDAADLSAFLPCMDGANLPPGC